MSQMQRSEAVYGNQVFEKFAASIEIKQLRLERKEKEDLND